MHEKRRAIGGVCRVRQWGWLLLILVVLMGCGDSPASANTPEEMFAAVIADPIPADVAATLEGTGDTWQGYQLFLRFRADEAFRETWLADYEAVDCAEVMVHFELPSPAYDKFTPSWTPHAIAAPICYERSGINNTWTHLGDHRVLLDPATNEVYFVGIGA